MSENNEAYLESYYVGNGIGHYSCSNCGTYINRKDKYCRECGSKIIGISKTYVKNKKELV